MASTGQKTVFWILTPCKIVGCHRRFWATCYFHRQGGCRNSPGTTVSVSPYKAKWHCGVIGQEHLLVSVALRNVRSVELSVNEHTGPFSTQVRPTAVFNMN